MARRAVFLCLASIATMAVANIAAPRANQAADRVSPPSPKSMRTAPAGKTAIDCSFHFDVSGRDGRITHSQEAAFAASTEGIDLRIHFGAGILPDTEIVAASHQPLQQQVGGYFVEARAGDRSDFRMESIGDVKPTYMREAPVLKVGSRWFVGDRIDFDRGEGLVSINMTTSLMEDFGRAGGFEMWWKGTRRLAFHAVPDKLPLEQFSSQCLAIPPPIRELTSKGNAMRALIPSASPHLMSFIGESKPLSFNLFNVHDSTEGSASFKILVGRDGLIKQCDLMRHSGKVPARPEACETIRRWTRFYPATDRSGVPVEAETDFSFNWTGRK